MDKLAFLMGYKEGLDKVADTTILGEGSVGNTIPGRWTAPLKLPKLLEPTLDEIKNWKPRTPAQNNTLVEKLIRILSGRPLKK